MNKRIRWITETAIMLALLDSDNILHPELECLFTVGEEVGMDGMSAFDTSLLKSRRMINLDSAGEGVATVSCAGGVRSDFTYTPKVTVPADNMTFYEMAVTGLYGGHSGEDINLGRCNAIETTARALRFIGAQTDVYLVSWYGGEKDNAIPRDCKVTFAVAEGVDLEPVLQKVKELVKHELVPDDYGFNLECWCTDRVSSVINNESSAKIIDFISTFRSGPVMMSRGINGLVETSYNLSVIRVDTAGVKVTVTSRSSVEAALDDMELKMKLLFLMV